MVADIAEPDPLIGRLTIWDYVRLKAKTPVHVN